MGASFFASLFDNELTQRSDIDDAARAAADARFYGDLALSNVEQLRTQVLSQRDQIRDLSVAVAVLVKMLAEAGTVDDKVLRYRVEAELEERLEASRPENRTTTCIRCKQQVAAARTQVTDDGTVCDRCMAGV
jgi:formylmethanofuran dehydrogenase subunit E